MAIHVVKDIIDTIRLRDFYIRKVESQKNLAQILAVRDSAIIHFAKELHEFSNVKYSPLTLYMIQYINLKVYDSFKTTELAKHFLCLKVSSINRKIILFSYCLIFSSEIPSLSLDFFILIFPKIYVQIL